MSGAPTRDELVERAKLLANAMCAPEAEWETLPLPPDVLKMVDEAKAQDPDNDDIAVFEVDEHGKPIPLTEASREYFREERINITGSQSLSIPVPEGWNDEETKLACLLLEAAIFKTGTQPFMFNSPTAGALFSCDLLRNLDDPEDRFIRMGTNVIGHVQSLAYDEICSKIEETMKDFEQGWKMSRKEGQTEYSKPVKMEGDFPFLFEWMHAYAQLADQVQSLNPTIGYHMKDTHNYEENRRYSILLDHYQLPPVIEIGMDKHLAKTMKDNGFKLNTSPKRGRE